MEIIKDLNSGTRKYKFIHWGCCEFIAIENEFKWTAGQYNKTNASVVCPKCGKQFYQIPQIYY